MDIVEQRNRLTLAAVCPTGSGGKLSNIYQLALKWLLHSFFSFFCETFCDWAGTLANCAEIWLSDGRMRQRHGNRERNGGREIESEGRERRGKIEMSKLERDRVGHLFWSLCQSYGLIHNLGWLNSSDQSCFTNARIKISVWHPRSWNYVKAEKER